MPSPVFAAWSNPRKLTSISLSLCSLPPLFLRLCNTISSSAPGSDLSNSKPPNPNPQNRAKAYRVLRARLLDRKLQAEQDERRSVRRTQVRGTDRSEKIRTYNFPQVRFFLFSSSSPSCCCESYCASASCFRSGRDSFTR